MHILVNRVLAKLAMIVPGGFTVRPAFHRWRGVRLGRNVWISQFVYLDEIYPEAISIGDDCTLGLRSSVLAHFHWGPRHAGGFRPVTIESDVFVGPHCVILPGVRIGAGAVIKAGSVVSRNVPPAVFWGNAGGGPLGTVSVPLTPRHNYHEFVRGLRPASGTTSAPDDKGVPLPHRSP